MKRKRHINEFIKTGFECQGIRSAGMGILYDRYDDESGGPSYGPGTCMFNKQLTPEERLALDGPVVTYKLSKEELKKYKGEQ